MGLIFIVSAYSKLFPIEPFEYNIVGTTFIGWKLSVILARFILAIEFFLGVMLIFSYRHRLIVPLASGLIILFSVHLVFQLITKGNGSDCGCFGSLLIMTPLQALIKNIIMLIVLFIIYKLAFNFQLKFKSLEFYFFIIAITVVFVVNPVDYGYSENYLNKPFDRYELNIDTLYHSTNYEKIGKPTKDIRKGKYIVAFMSSTCGHCKIAAKKFSVIHAENQQIPIYFFINGEDAAIQKFRNDNEIGQIPYSKLNGQVFISLAGLQLPMIYYLNNSYVEKQVDYFTLEQDHIENWLLK